MNILQIACLQSRQDAVKAKLNGLLGVTVIACERGCTMSQFLVETAMSADELADLTDLAVTECPADVRDYL